MNRLGRILCLVAMVASLACQAAAFGSPAVADTPETSTSYTATPPGAELPSTTRITAVLDKHRWFLGENVLVYVHVEGTGKGPAVVGSPDGFTLTTVDANGRVLADPEPYRIFRQGVTYLPRSNTQAYWFTMSLGHWSRIEKPGVYTISVLPSPPWQGPDSNPPAPVKLAVEMVMPRADEARQVLAQMDVLKPDNWGEYIDKREPAYREFSQLRYPVYLPMLANRAKAVLGDSYAETVNAIGEIPTPTATRTLIDLMDQPDLNRATVAAEALGWRLPDPKYDPKAPARFIGNGPIWYADMLYLSGRSWDPVLAEAACSTAKRLLDSGNERAIGAAASIFMCVGRPADLGSITQELDSLLAQNRIDTLGARGDNNPTYRETAERLMDAGRYIVARGAAGPSVDSTSPGSMLIWADLLAHQPPKSWPTGWQAEIGRLFAIPNHSLRSLALQQLYTVKGAPELEGAYDPFLSGMIDDNDLSTQIYATYTAELTHNPKFAPAILAALANCNTYDFRPIVDAAFTLGVGWDACNIMVNRVVDHDSAEHAAETLYHLVKGSVGLNANYDPPYGPLRERWYAFLIGHKAEIEAGKRYGKDDPEIKLLLPDNRLTFN